MDFAIGNRVVCVVSYGNVRVGETGTLVHFNEYAPEYGVRWDIAKDLRHDCLGNCESKHGWYVYRKNIKAEAEQDFGEFNFDNPLLGLFGG